MYEFLDRPVTSLDQGGRFLVWSMRSWVKAMAERVCPGNAVGPAFARQGAITGLQPFLRVMALFNRHGLETFHFCQLGCNHVSEHEAIILSLVCSLREGRPEAIRDTLALLVDEDGLGDVLSALMMLEGSLQRAAIPPARTPWSPQDHSATKH